MTKKPQGYTAVNIKFEAKVDLDLLQLALSHRAGQRLSLSDTITVARQTIEVTQPAVARKLRRLVRQMDRANDLEDLGERGMAMSQAWAELGQLLTDSPMFGVSEVSPRR